MNKKRRYDLDPFCDGDVVPTTEGPKPKEVEVSTASPTCFPSVTGSKDISTWEIAKWEPSWRAQCSQAYCC